jgi:hypothetical protein
MTTKGFIIGQIARFVNLGNNQYGSRVSVPSHPSETLDHPMMQFRTKWHHDQHNIDVRGQHLRRSSVGLGATQLIATRQHPRDSLTFDNDPVAGHRGNAERSGKSQSTGLLITTEIRPNRVDLATVHYFESADHLVISSVECFIFAESERRKNLVRQRIPYLGSCR